MIQWPTGTQILVPNSTNPVEVESLSTLLKEVADMLPEGTVTCIGIHVEPENY